MQTAKTEQPLAEPPYFFRLKLQTNQEQQQHHPKLGEMQDLLGVGDQLQGIRSDQNARQQVAQHGAEPQALEQRHREHGGGEIDCSLNQKVGRTHDVFPSLKLLCYKFTWQSGELVQPTER